MKSFFSLASFLLFFCSSMFAQPFSEKMLEGAHIRSVGPAGMSGRITAIDVVLNDPEHIYIGSASGGVWESKDGGTTWLPIFDDQPTLSIGAIKINQQNPSEIWVGTGEGNPRNSQNSGKGLFRTLDGGKTWKYMGLKETKVIHRILIDFHNPATVYVGAAGSPWGAGEHRGVYKTIDNGATWDKILYTNEQSGIGDMVMDPHNPRKIIAAMYEHIRTPWDFKSGGLGSGLYLTYDGGATWKKLTDKEGLPKGMLGRIGLSIAHAKPNVVYALIEAKTTGLYKSTDGGENWSLVATENIGNRPFYYSDIYVDTKNENRIWNLWSYVSKSEDGGKTFRTVLDYGKSVHPDHHAFWIHPDDPNYIIDGNDGGLNISRDGGENWYFCANIPVGQFYHVDIDHDFPFNLYGGMQDNGSWVGPAFVLKSGGIRNQDWRELYFGDGFDVQPKLSDTRYGWAMSQGGNLTYYDRETGFNQFVKPVHPDGDTLRFNWNAPIARVAGNDCGLYYGSQYVHRSLDCGKSWEIISPDLTTNDTAKQQQHKSGGLTIDATNAENHTTILCIAPSPLNSDVIWVGTDDGNLQLTKDGGATWTNLNTNLPGYPGGAWIPQIEVSGHNEGEAFVVVNNYRRDDWKAYAYHTLDFGATWKNIITDSQVTSFVHAIVQDPVEQDLLFLGADDGLYVSRDHGTSWARFPAKVFPRVPVTDMKIHPYDHSLVIGTFGRSLYVMDNLLPWRELTQSKDLLDNKFTFFPSKTAIQSPYRSVDGIRFGADAEFRGENRRGGARLVMYVKPAEKKDTTVIASNTADKKKKKEKVKPEIAQQDTIAKDSTALTEKEKKDKDVLKLYVLDEQRDTIRYIRHKLTEGWNEFGWDMRNKGVQYPSRRDPPEDADDPSGQYVKPGQYTLVGLFNDQKDSTVVKVQLDPRLEITSADLDARNALINTLNIEINRAHVAFKALMDAGKDIKMIESFITNAPDSTKKEIRDSIKVIKKELARLEEGFMRPADAKGYTSEINLGTYLYETGSYLNSSLGDPGSNARNLLTQTQSEVSKHVEAVNDFLNTDWDGFQKWIAGFSWPVFKEIERPE